MLILSRKLGEQIVIGDNIILTVVAIRGMQIRLGITAPADLSIQREELCPEGEESVALPVRPPALEAEP